jgi:hypothetical protein
VTPGIQNLIRENKSFRIDSEIQTGKRYGMQLLDDNLYMNFQAGKISAEEAIDKSRNPGMMVDKMQKAGLNIEKKEDFPEAGEDPGAAGSPAVPKPPAPGGAGGAAQSEAERQAQIAANRARMAAMQQKK